MADALYGAGYGSPSRVYESANAALGMTPATFAKGGAGARIGYAIATPATTDRLADASSLERCPGAR